MSLHGWIVYCLSLLSVMTLAFSAFRQHFESDDLYKVQVQSLRKNLERERLKQQLTVHQMKNLKEEVARILPEALRGQEFKEKAYPLRRLASVVYTEKKDELLKGMASKSFKDVKRVFRGKDYAKAAEELKAFIHRYSFSTHLPEAYFLLVESYYRMQKFEKSLQITEKMVNLYPSAEVTGYALLRMGRIYQYRDRYEEALEVYKTVLASFPYPDVANQARQSIGALKL